MTALCSSHFRISCELQDDDGKSGTLGNNILYLSCTLQSAAMLWPCARTSPRRSYFTATIILLSSAILQQLLVKHLVRSCQTVADKRRVAFDRGNHQTALSRITRHSRNGTAVVRSGNVATARFLSYVPTARPPFPAGVHLNKRPVSRTNTDR